MKPSPRSLAQAAVVLSLVATEAGEGTGPAAEVATAGAHKTVSAEGRHLTSCVFPESLLISCNGLLWEKASESHPIRFQELFSFASIGGSVECTTLCW